MIHGESYKPIVAEAAHKAASEVYNRIMVTHLLMDSTKPNRVAGAVGFNVRTGDYHVFRAKAVIVCAGGASHIFKPRAVGENIASYVRRVRLERAGRKLRMGAVDITEVALAAGYDTHAAFSKAFKQHFGLSPSEFRQLDCWSATQILSKG